MNLRAPTGGTAQPADPLRVPSSEVMRPSLTLLSYEGFKEKLTALNNHVLPLALYRLKTYNMQKLLGSVILLTIVSIPTWKTQHVRYSSERCKLLKLLLDNTLLTALVEQYYINTGVLIEVTEDDNHFLTFTKQPTPVNPLFSGDSSPIPNETAPRRDAGGRFSKSDEGLSDEPTGEPLSEEKEQDELLSPTSSPIAPSPMDTSMSDDLYRARTRESSRTDLCETAGRMFKQWIGSNFRQKNYLLTFLQSKGLQPDTDVLDILMLLDDILLGGDNFTPEYEDKLMNDYADQPCADSQPKNSGLLAG